jgi:hypothetical protein
MPPTGTVEQLLDAMHTRSRGDINRLIQFTGAHPNTVGGWLLGTSKPPMGEMLIRVAFFFELSGWKVSEMSAIDTLVAGMARYWMAEVATASDLKHALHYTAESNSDLLALFHNSRHPLYTQDLQSLLESKRTEYDRRFKKLVLEFGMSQDASESPPPPAPAVSQLLPKHQALIISQLAALLREAKPLAERVNSDDFTDEQRALLREEVGKFEYFELSTTLNQLTGPRPRKAKK